VFLFLSRASLSDTCLHRAAPERYALEVRAPDHFDDAPSAFNAKIGKTEIRLVQHAV